MLSLAWIWHLQIKVKNGIKLNNFNKSKQMWMNYLMFKKEGAVIRETNDQFKE